MVRRSLPGWMLILLAFSALPAQQGVVYVQASTGLETPEFEGGDTEIEMADLDLDGHLDLVSVGDHGNPRVNTDQEGIIVWFGDGTGIWTMVQGGDLGYGGVAVGDVNDDGIPDVGYGIHHNYSATDLGDQLLEVALGNGTGSGWTPWDDGLAGEGQSWGLFATDFGDVDADGDLDIGSSGFGSSDGFHAYLNDRDGSWRRSYGFLGGNSDHVFCFGDVDGDGHLDVATAKQEGTVWLGDGEGFFVAADDNLPALPAFGLREGPSMGDVDGDGRDDLAYCTDDGDAAVWLRRDSSWLDVTGNLPALGHCQRTQLHDMNGDGLVDLIVFGQRRLQSFAGDGGNGVWTALTDFNTPDNPGNVRAFRVGGDFDHNGLADVVLVDTQRVDIFNTQNQVRAYREATPATALQVRAVRPGPNRILLAGSIRWIEWAATVPTPPAAITLELSLTGVAGPWETIASSLPDHGRYQWLVPAETCSDCRIRVTADAGGDSAMTIGPSFAIERRPDPMTIDFPDKQTVRFTDGLTRDRANLYRGSGQRLVDTGEYQQDPGADPLADRFCDLEGVTQQTDAYEPPSGEWVFYLATGYRLFEDGQQPGTPVAMAESVLGQRTGAVMRERGDACSP